MAENAYIDVKEVNGSDKAESMADRLSPKVNSLERIFLVANFILELPSAAFDQLSSVHKPQYAVLSMLMSFLVLIISIADLVYKGRKEKVTWMKKGLIPWFYKPSPNSKPFGTFPDIVGLFCAVFQFIFASIAFAFLSRHADNPVKVSVWPIIFAFGLLYSRVSGIFLENKPTLPARRLHRLQEFTLAEIAASTNDFSQQHMIGVSCYGEVYRGKLADGREVVIKRGQRYQKITDELQEIAFESELEFLSRLHHKHLNRLVGYSEDGDESLLVYEYMKNGSLYDHLHHENNNAKNSSVINSWKMRFKIALDAARGIEYLHSYAVPPVIHRDIKSAVILLDETWTARVVGFGISVKSPQPELGSGSIKFIGTTGYIDPESFDLNVLTTKVDVYSFGVVLLELLTGKRAIFINEDDSDRPTSLVEYAVPRIISGERSKILDPRVSLPEHSEEAEAVEVVAYTALHCVNSDGKNRPRMSDVVANLEHSLSLLSSINQSQC